MPRRPVAAATTLFDVTARSQTKRPGAPTIPARAFGSSIDHSLIAPPLSADAIVAPWGYLHLADVDDLVVRPCRTKGAPGPGVPDENLTVGPAERRGPPGRSRPRRRCRRVQSGLPRIAGGRASTRPRPAPCLPSRPGHPRPRRRGTSRRRRSKALDAGVTVIELEREDCGEVVRPSSGPTRQSTMLPDVPPAARILPFGLNASTFGSMRSPLMSSIEGRRRGRRGSRRSQSAMESCRGAVPARTGAFPPPRAIRPSLPRTVDMRRGDSGLPMSQTATGPPVAPTI